MQLSVHRVPLLSMQQSVLVLSTILDSGNHYSKMVFCDLNRFNALPCLTRAYCTQMEMKDDYGPHL